MLEALDTLFGKRDYAAKERTVGLGPGIQLGGQGIRLRVNRYIETDVRDRPNGIKVTLRISKALPTAEPQP